MTPIWFLAGSCTLQWTAFMQQARESGIFRGGSAIANAVQLGEQKVSPVTDSIDGFMRFETDDIERLHALLRSHPVVLCGGTLELCEMPRS
jgi:tRNA 2-selenouridine synthase SelU